VSGALAATQEVDVYRLAAVSPSGADIVFTGMPGQVAFVADANLKPTGGVSRPVPPAHTAISSSAMTVGLDYFVVVSADAGATSAAGAYTLAVYVPEPQIGNPCSP
jgi:hypothetical protein